MRYRSSKTLSVIVFIAITLLITIAPVLAQETEELPLAEIVNDEVARRCAARSHIPSASPGRCHAVIILEDQAGFVDRNRHFLMPVESQTLGQITSDFYTSPFTYSLAMPAVPQGSYRDVDHDAEEETGIQVFAVAYWSNTWGDPYLEERDLYGGGWSTAYARPASAERRGRIQIVGGEYVVMPDDQREHLVWR
jgi:hypothetical protein